MKRQKYFLLSVIGLVLLWELIAYWQLVPEFMLPSFSKVMKTLVSEMPLLLTHLQVTLFESLIGMLVSVLLSITLVFVIDRIVILRQIVMPYIIVSQTIPTIAVAPLLTLWLGYGLLPKIVLIIFVCFFPLTMALLNGLSQIDNDLLRQFQLFNASSMQTMIYLKWPSCLPYFFSGLKMAASYAVVSAVIAEWLGGDYGLGVYMTRVRKSFAFDKMFAVILLTSLLSLLLVWVIKRMEKYCLRYKNKL